MIGKFIRAYSTKSMLSSIFLLHWKDHLKSQYNFFGRIFVSVFFVKIFNFIGCANYTTCDITVHDAFEKGFSKCCQTIQHKLGGLLIPYPHTRAISVIFYYYLLEIIQKF